MCAYIFRHVEAGIPMCDREMTVCDREMTVCDSDEECLRDGLREAITSEEPDAF